MGHFLFLQNLVFTASLGKDEDEDEEEKEEEEEKAQEQGVEVGRRAHSLLVRRSSDLCLSRRPCVTDWLEHSSSSGIRPPRSSFRLGQRVSEEHG